MSLLSLFIIALGIVPISLALVFKILVALRVIRLIHGSFRFQSFDHWYPIPSQVPWKPIGRSAIHLSELPSSQAEQDEPIFSTLHCTVEQKDKAKWRLAVEFELRNPPLNPEIVIDDIHTCLFERNAYAPPLATVSFYGDVWLKQDNSILKEKQEYSLPSGHAYIINLLFEVSRVEAAPAYGWQPSEQEGSAVIVFGLLLDYYWNTNGKLERRAIPSDCVYLFRHAHKEDTIELQALAAQEIRVLREANAGNKQAEEFLERVEAYFSKHIKFRATPVP